MFIVQQEWYTKDQLKANPETLFIFGDNAERLGTGGQAKICRFEPNVIGIITKWDRYRNPGSYMYDQTYEYNIQQIEKGFWTAQLALLAGKDVIWPSDGIGTGLALLPANAPRTLVYIQRRFDDLMRLYAKP